MAHRRLTRLTPGWLRLLRRCYTQTLFVDGEIRNVSDRQVEAWTDRLNELRPLGAQIYSLDRPPAHGGLRQVPRRELEAIARKAESRTGVPVTVF